MGTLCRSVINLPELLRIRADQRGRQTQTAAASAASRDSSGLPPDVRVAVSPVVPAVIRYFQLTKVWHLGANIVVTGSTSTGTVPVSAKRGKSKKGRSAVQAVAVVTPTSIGQLITPTGVAISPDLYTIFSVAQERLAQTAAPAAQAAAPAAPASLCI